MDQYLALLPGTLGVAYAVSMILNEPQLGIRVEVVQYTEDDEPTGEYTVILSSLYVDAENLDDYIAMFEQLSKSILSSHRLQIDKIDSMTGIIINISIRLHLENVQQSDILALMVVDGGDSTGLLYEIEEIERDVYSTRTGYNVLETLGPDYNYNQVTIVAGRYMVRDYSIDY